MNTNRTDYLWNPVFTRVMEIKDAYERRFGELRYNDYAVDGLWERMIKLLNVPEYTEWAQTLKVTQNGSRILLHYDLIASAADMWANPLTSINVEARSIYIDLKTDEIILCPMPKFFNVGEVDENSWDKVFARIDKAKNIELTNKMDGSNQNATYYEPKGLPGKGNEGDSVQPNSYRGKDWGEGEYVLTGSTACDPDNSWRIVEGYKFLNTPGYRQMLKDNPGKTFCFELIHPDDVHVVSYAPEQMGLYLIRLRDNKTGIMSSYKEAREIAAKYPGVLTVQAEPFTKADLDSGLASIRSSYKADEKEGCVLDIDGYMIKVKCDDYLKVHSLFGAKSATKVLIQAISDGNADDIIASLDDINKAKIMPVYDSIKDAVAKKYKAVDDYYASCPVTDSQKDFAIYVNKTVPKEYRGYMFAMRSGKEVNLLKSASGRYATAEDFGIADVKLRIGSAQNSNRDAENDEPEIDE